MSLSLQHRIATIAAVTVAVGGLFAATASEASASNNKVVYLHGRSMQGWPSSIKATTSTSWDHVFATYNGDARLTDATVRSQVKSLIQTNCSAGNQCAVVCYSAGCARMLLAYNDLKAAGVTTNVVWTQATASAAGGSELAVMSTHGITKFLAKITGNYADIDNDIQPSVMRSGTSFGYIQNSTSTAMYQIGGNQNMCRRFVGIKFCGNKYFPGGIGDGVVPPHSSCGFTDTNAHGDCGTGNTGKYTNRFTNSGSGFASLNSSDHRGMLADGVNATSTRFSWTSTISMSPFGVITTLPDGDNVTDDHDAVPNDTRPLYYDIGYNATAFALNNASCVSTGCALSSVNTYRCQTGSNSSYNVADCSHGPPSMCQNQLYGCSECLLGNIPDVMQAGTQCGGFGNFYACRSGYMCKY